MLVKLENYGIRGGMQWLVSGLLMSQATYVTGGISHGLPQWCVISPLLFLIYILYFIFYIWQHTLILLKYEGKTLYLYLTAYFDTTQVWGENIIFISDSIVWYYSSMRGKHYIYIWQHTLILLKYEGKTLYVFPSYLSSIKVCCQI